MCGIFGYIGDKDAEKVITEGLKRLEYRGYDSWGIAVKKDDKIHIRRKVGEIGEIEEIKQLPETFVGIGHTRWATHGGVTRNNAHPHFSTDMTFVVAQNGIVENYQELKKMLQEKGFKFETQTDTEVIVRLVELKLRETKELKEAVRQAFLDLEGRNTVIVLEKDTDHIIAVRNGSPLVAGLGRGENGDKEYFLASDILSFAHHTDQVVFMNDYQMIEITSGDLKLYEIEDGNEVQIEVQTVEPGEVDIDKEGYEHFMIKEIVEQQHTIKDATNYSEEELSEFVEALKSARNVYTVGAGTAGYAAGQIAYYLRKIAKVNALELKSYEMDSYKGLIGSEDIVIAVSQSGETADTIEALEFAKENGAKLASIVNMMGSTITRMSDYEFYSRSGPEICVASTKAFTSQVSWGYLVAKTVAGEFGEAKMNISKASEALEGYFTEELFEQVKSLADRIKDQDHFFVLGRGMNYYISLEGALKIKEITYKHFEGFAAGELKHGVIALIDKGTPVFCVVSDDEVRNDMISAAAEVNARGALTVGIGDNPEQDFFEEFIEAPQVGDLSPITNVIPFQLVSYFLGLVLGNNIDKPRNLAKSVTVK
jgi:glucosamine--fructose-6-phosphate aminotransferase (isomerizing)